MIDLAQPASWLSVWFLEAPLRVLSGIQPSGRLHIGNYFGAMRQHLHLQAEHEGFYFIADYHALTSNPSADALAQHTLDVAMDYMALGARCGQDGLLASVGRARGGRTGLAAVLRNPPGAAPTVRQLQGQGRPGAQPQPRPVRLPGPPGGRHPDLQIPSRPRRGPTRSSISRSPEISPSGSTTPTARFSSCRTSTSSSPSPSFRAPTAAK